MHHFTTCFALALLNLISAPALWHVQRFDHIHIEQVRDNLAFNSGYRSFLYRKRDLFPQSDLIPMYIREADTLYKAWDGLRDAKTHYYSDWLKRQGLQQVLNVVGVDAFLRGEMPPPVPFWRFTELR